MIAGICVGEAGADREVLDGLRDEHLARLRKRRHTGADRHRDPADLRIDELDFASVDTSSYSDSQRLHGVDDRLRTAHRAGRAVERGKEAVTGGVDLGSPVSTNHRADRRVVAFDKALPGVIAELCSSVRRANEVGEQHGRQDTIECRLLSMNGPNEAFDLAQ